MSITKKDVEHVARLARLSLREAEKDRYTAQLGSILEYIEKLNQLDTSKVPPLTHVLPVANVWREDVAQPSPERGLGSPAEIVNNAPERDGPFFKVRKVIE